ncbi:class F sortase [Streptohalobacillus salinus]|uniref:class F sortase n=1 Tax=Streptohalobacillus salinus TaxID=621096 RepID=UPI0011B248AF|nr:class F sortase [Streptohalobacillus salinus]
MLQLENMRSIDKLIILGLSVMLLLSLSQFIAETVEDTAYAATLTSQQANQRTVFQPTFKSDGWDRSETASVRTLALTPVRSGPAGVIPHRLTIPSLHIDAAIERVGIAADGKMGVPDDGDNVGWFEKGPQPGASGQAVLAGHVDDQGGAAVFYHLSDLALGDVVHIHDDKGQQVTFKVIDKAVYPYDTTAVADVFGPSSDTRLNLITCTGEFDQQARTHRERLVVFTERVTH